MKTRLDLADWLPKNAVCAEVGVFKGEYSAELLKRCDPKEFYMVDLFDREFTSGGVDGYHIETADLRVVLQELIGLYGANPKVRLIKSEAIEWFNSLPENYLDWIYLDTSHSYPATIAELPAARRAVKAGGFICGHDYHPDFQLKAAVDEFVERLQLPMEIWDGDRYGSFCITNTKD